MQLSDFKRKKHGELVDKIHTTIPYTYLYEHLKKQREEDITKLVKPKEIMFCGRSNIGKSSIINAVFNSKLCRQSKHAGCTKTLNYYRIAAMNSEHFVVDSPGYGYLGMKNTSGEKLRKMIAKYARDSSRLCKIFVLIDLKEGICEEDLEFFEEMKDVKMGLELVLSRADRVNFENWSGRALGIGQQAKKYYSFINPIAHVVSAQYLCS